MALIAPLRQIWTDTRDIQDANSARTVSDRNDTWRFRYWISAGASSGSLTQLRTEAFSPIQGKLRCARSCESALTIGTATRTTRKEPKASGSWHWRISRPDCHATIRRLGWLDFRRWHLDTLDLGLALPTLRRERRTRLGARALRLAPMEASCSCSLLAGDYIFRCRRMADSPCSSTQNSSSQKQSCAEWAGRHD